MKRDRSFSSPTSEGAPLAAAQEVAWATFIRSRRIHLRLRQDELAALAGVSTRSVHALESGKATARLDLLLAVTSTLGLKLCVHSPSASSEIASAAKTPEPVRTQPPAKETQAGEPAKPAVRKRVKRTVRGQFWPPEGTTE